MKIYKLGDPSKPTIMLFPGTCCYWKTNFGHTFENLQKYFYVMVVSYSGFDETENTTFISELDEVKKVEHYIQSKLHGKLFAAYGCSLGGSFVSLLVNRQKIHVKGTVILVFYAKKMGEKYLDRYLKYFKDPDICEFDLGHEELLLDAERWTHEICRVCGIAE